jgi:lysozyme
MKTSIKGIDFIKSFENFSPISYICPSGFQTIGYGHVVGRDENFDNISEMYAEEILVQDLCIAETSVFRNITAPLEQNQFDALVSFVFNLGGGSLQRSSLRQKINYGSDECEIYNEFVKWVYAGGRKLLGLMRRREAEAGMYLC